MPKGFWNISLEVSHEWDTNGFAEPGPSTSFSPTGELETAWMYPFNIGPVSAQFTGFMNIIGPKGQRLCRRFLPQDRNSGASENFIRCRQAGGLHTGKLMAGVGYEFWMNKFGSTKPPLSGTQEHTVFFEVGYNFD